MADWQEQLNTILSDPDAMAQIASIAQSLGGAPATEPEGGNPPPKADAAQLTGALDPELLRRLAPLMQEFNRPESSEATALLMALRPFLSRKRRDKVERAAQLARLIHLGKTFLTGEGGVGSR
ncbi:MAG: hypothetical protein IKN81_07995 [Oscillospiraceae bacterium]|nr:hypothetical protein [Oscillospiraceae bacterium]